MYNTHSAVGIVRTILNSKGYDVVFIDELQAYTDGRTVYVPKPSPSFTQQQGDLWMYMIFHEIGHNDPRCRDMLPYIKDNNIGGWMGQLLGLAEDYRQEKINQDGTYQGRDEICERGRYLWSMHTVDSDEVGTVTDPKKAVGASLYAAFDEIRTRTGFMDLTGVYDRYMRLLPPEFQEKTATVVNEYADSLNECKNPKELHEWLERVLREVYAIDPESITEPCEAPGSGKGKGKKGDGELRKGKSKAKSHSDKEGDDKDDIDSSECEYLESKIPDSHDEIHEWKESNTAIHWIFENITNGHPQYRFNHVISPEDHPQRMRGDWGPVPYGGLDAKVRKLLQIRTQTYYEGGYRRGKIHARGLHRVPTGHDNVFRRKHESLAIDAAVSILVDHSGSMGGQKFKHAVHACCMLHAAIAPLNIPVEILGFADWSPRERHGYRSEEPHIIEYCPFGRRMNKETLLGKFNRCAAGGNNDDVAAVLCAYHRLAQQTAKNKVLIVLSDGSPAHGFDGNPAGALKRLIGELEKRIKVYGIGIMDSNVKKFYSHRTVVNRSEELPNKLLEVIDSQLLK